MAKKKPSRPVTVGDLPERAEHGVKLYCAECGSEYSADRGDYFLRDRAATFEHRHGRRTVFLKLVQKIVHYVELTP